MFFSLTKIKIKTLNTQRYANNNRLVYTLITLILTFLASNAQVYTSCAFACWCFAPNPKGTERFALSLLSRYASAAPILWCAVFLRLTFIMRHEFCGFCRLFHTQNPINIMLRHLQIYHLLPCLFVLGIEFVFL